MLVRFEHILHLDKLLLSLVQVLGEHIIVKRQIVVGVGKMLVLADAQRDIGVVDRVLHFPVPSRVTIVQVCLPLELGRWNLW